VKIPGIEKAIRVRRRVVQGAVETTVSIDQLIPDPACGGPARWRISSKPARLSSKEFESAAQVNRRFSDGRAIRCIDLDSDTATAALGYHLDDREELPVLVTNIVIRSDARWTFVSQGCVSILKAYLHELGSKLGRTSDVGYCTTSENIADACVDLYAFRRAGVPSAWRRFGAYYLLQKQTSD
jgi:hypothetical protein